MIKVCHLTSVHQAQDVRIFEKECISLAKAGYDVSFVVPNTISQEVNQVKVVGVNVTSKSRFSRVFHTAQKVVNTALELKADVYHFHDPELLLYAKKLKQNGAFVIYDAHEDVPRQIKDKVYIPKMFRTLISKAVENFENRIAKRVLSGVVGATPHITNRFIAQGVKTVNVNNYPKLESFTTPGVWGNRENTLCYVGGIFKKRGAIEMVQSLEGLSTQLHLAGNYSPMELKQEMVNCPSWNKVVEHGFVDRKAINDMLSKAKIGLVLLHPTESYVKSLPIKMFEYMAAGIPVIASDFPLWKSIIETHECGVCVDPLNIDEIQKAVIFLLTNDEKAAQMGVNGRKAVENHYTWENEAKKLVSFYQKCC